MIMMIIFTSDDSNVEVDQMSIQSSTSRCTMYDISLESRNERRYTQESRVQYGKVCIIPSSDQIRSDQLCDEGLQPII